MESIEAFILAGGASRRMGTDKSQLLLDGQTLAQRIADVLLKVASTVTIVGRETANSQLTCVEDVYPEWGALGGLHAALSACNTDWAFVVACDMPFISEALVLRLESLRGDFEAVAPVQPDGRPQPLCSLYRVSPCLATAEKLIQSGERKPVTLLQSVRTRWVYFAELNDLPDAASFFDNMNTPEDYSRAQSKGESLHKKD
jgi:molybdopterin-guanine dinucleotide biosynthesis protein A